MDDWGNQLQHEAINVRFEKGVKRMETIEAEARAVREELHRLTQLRDEIAELVEFFRDMKGAFKVLRWIGKLAAPMTAIIGLGVALAAAWAAARGGLPK